MQRSGKVTTLESAVVAAFPWLLAGLGVSLLLLLLPPSDDRRWDLLLHLSGLVAFSFALTWRLVRLGDEPWFSRPGWPDRRRRLGTAASLIVIVTGVTALLTLASSAAMQYQPSLQFLQLLSALDIAWVVAGTMLALRILWGNLASLAGGAMMSVVCVVSIALYLAEVGLTADDAWLVDGGQMLRLVLPFDVAAALITVTLTALAAHRGSADGASEAPVV
ncbi:MAG: hypothetical protein QNJ77_15370 [Acidimicrobiia bacterium]|nr:hypothetical protein [Acidimicrobiia bacterium]